MRHFDQLVLLIEILDKYLYTSRISIIELYLAVPQYTCTPFFNSSHHPLLYSLCWLLVATHIIFKTQMHAQRMKKTPSNTCRHSSHPALDHIPFQAWLEAQRELNSPSLKKACINNTNILLSEKFRGCLVDFHLMISKISSNFTWSGEVVGRLIWRS